ncbi:MAG TPA: hypothetical protein VKD70_03425 [Candidatus Acidoferrum sp.]|nr:hypothetical protein [Candidatus Acidoferrum sp.]
MTNEVHEVDEIHRKTAVDLRPIKLNINSPQGIAMAPHGSRVAILSGPTLHVFDVKF